MNDDIVTLMRTDIQECDCNFRNGKCFICIIEIQAADEIERLRTLLDKTLERENKDNARQLEIVRKVEADRDRWKKWGDIAEEMYKYLAQEWCWHCGATLERHYKVDEILDKYREAVDGCHK